MVSLLRESIRFFLSCIVCEFTLPLISALNEITPAKNNESEKIADGESPLLFTGGKALATPAVRRIAGEYKVCGPIFSWNFDADLSFPSPFL